MGESVCPKTYCSAHDEWLIVKLCMYVGYHGANNVSNFCGDPVTQLNFKKFFFMKLDSLLSARCRHRSMNSSSMEGHTSLSTILVYYAKSFPFVEPASYLLMVESFGAYFKDLTLVYVNSKCPMSRDCVEVIECLTRCCRYDRLALDVINQAGDMCLTDLNIMAQLVTNQHLKSFTLLGVTCFDIRMLVSNDKLNGCLGCLSSHTRAGWSSHGGISNPHHAVSQSEVGCHQPVNPAARPLLVLSDDLIVNLSDQGRAPLRELGIEVMHTILHPNEGLQHIEAGSWTRLRTHSSCLQVHVFVLFWVPCDVLFRSLLPEIPLASISINRHLPCRGIRSLADRFSSTLPKVRRLIQLLKHLRKRIRYRTRFHGDEM